jgi:antitoxin CptB
VANSEWGKNRCFRYSLVRYSASPLAIRYSPLYIPLARPRPGFWRLHIDAVREAMTERSSAGLDERRRRLLFRAWRRGMREMDLIVGRFADAHIDKFDATELDQFEQLIEVPNAELYAWIVGNEAVPRERDSQVLRQMIAFHNHIEAKP